HPSRRRASSSPHRRAHGARHPDPARAPRRSRPHGNGVTDNAVVRLTAVSRRKPGPTVQRLQRLCITLSSWNRDPLRIVALDQLDFPRALPFLDLALAPCSGRHALMRFEPYERIDAVFGGEATDHLCFMLPNPPNQIWRAPDVKRSVRFAGEDID